MMDTPSRRYDDAVRFFRAYATAEGMKLVERPATLDEIEHAERELGAAFPNSYRWFQLEFGDVQGGPIDIYTVRPPQPSYKNIVGINMDERTELYPHLPPHLIAFSDDGGGNHACFDTARRNGGECPVVWWDHEQDEDQKPEDAAASFPEWLEDQLKEIASDERGSPLDWLPDVHKQWIDEWRRRFSK